MYQLTYIQTRCCTKNAFSVVGLMVVVAIIGIVVAIALPAQIRSRQINAARACQENLARIDGAVEAYALQNSLSATSPVTLDNLLQTTGTGFLQEISRCPAGGTYTVTMTGTAPTCSIGLNPHAPYAPHQ